MAKKRYWKMECVCDWEFNDRRFRRITNALRYKKASRDASLALDVILELCEELFLICGEFYCSSGG